MFQKFDLTKTTIQEEAIVHFLLDRLRLESCPASCSIFYKGEVGLLYEMHCPIQPGERRCANPKEKIIKYLYRCFPKEEINKLIFEIYL